MFLAVHLPFSHFLVRETRYSLWELLLFHLVRLIIIMSPSKKALWNYRFNESILLLQVQSRSWHVPGKDNESVFRKCSGSMKEWRKLAIFLRAWVLKRHCFPRAVHCHLCCHLERACLSKTKKFSGPKFLGSNLTKMRRKMMLEK